jgi:predicted acyl esterase
MNPSTKPKHYLTNDTLIKELTKCHEQKRLTTAAVGMFDMLIDRIQKKLFYKSDDVRQDCKSHAMLIVVENWHKYDMTRTNPFAFFTRVVMNGLSYAWNKNERRPIHISINAFINNDAEDNS